MQKEWINTRVAGEADRRIPCLMPKHLFTGVRGVGKTDRRWEHKKERVLFLFSLIICI